MIALVLAQPAVEHKFDPWLHVGFPPIYPENAETYWRRGNIYGQLGKIDSVIGDMRQVIHLAPDIPDAYGQLGWYLILQNKLTEARISCNKAVELDNTKSFAWVLSLGHTYLLTGDGKNAETYYRTALEMIPDEETLTIGPLADFNLFISKGWQKEASVHWKEWFAKNKGKIKAHKRE